MVPGTFPLSLDLPQWSRSAIPRLYGCLPSEPLLSMQFGPGKKPTQAQFHFFSRQDLAFQAFNDPKSINREASETTLLGVTLGGWNATYFWTLGGNDVMVVPSILFRPLILICHDHCCCRTTSRMLKRAYCGQKH